MVGADGDPPAAFVERVVMVGAEEVEVGVFGGAVLGFPVLAVVGFAAGGGPVAAGEDAAAVAGDEDAA